MLGGSPGRTGSGSYGPHGKVYMGSQLRVVSTLVVLTTNVALTGVSTTPTKYSTSQGGRLGELVREVPGPVECTRRLRVYWSPARASCSLPSRAPSRGREVQAPARTHRKPTLLYSTP